MKTLFKLSLCVALFAVCGCPQGEPSEQKQKPVVQTQARPTIPNVAEYEALATSRLRNLKAKGGLDREIADIVQKMSEEYRMASDEKKRSLYDRIK